ncbi:hypothetical protein GCM10022197_04570 [Microlunatus spumicola]|uniref:Uncharacterized protein n=1 Tax=Microlunatus spumicola TaxID=81499 RepID=A0ABP6WND3_9ACTN
MRYQLVLQWSATSVSDLDALVSMEDVLESSLPPSLAFVDGHDVGADEMNIFVYTDDPLRGYEAAAELLGAHAGWPGVRAAYRLEDEEAYVTVWPEGLEHFSVT